MAYILLIRTLEAGLPLWFLAIPVCRTPASAFLWAENLARRVGPLPDVDLTIPTCSAEEVKGILSPLMTIGLVASASKTEKELFLSWKACIFVLSEERSTWYFLQKNLVSSKR